MIDKFLKVPILKRLIPSIYKKYIYLTKSHFKAIIVDGIIFDLDLRHFIDRRFFFYKTYEEELLNPLRKIIKDNNVDYFFDIGSAWGVYSLRLSALFPNLNIYAFDPIDKNIIRLKNSIKKNKLKNIKVFQTAIGSSKGSVELGATEDYSPNFKINEKNSIIRQKSKIDFLDNLFQFKKNTIILKIDTEAFELEVLKGAFNLLNNNNCYCQVEINPNDELNKEKIFSYFKSLGYQLISINNKNKLDYLFSNFINSNIEI